MRGGFTADGGHHVLWSVLHATSHEFATTTAQTTIALTTVPDRAFCEYTNIPGDSACEDGFYCTINDTCRDGVCQSGAVRDECVGPPEENGSNGEDGTDGLACWDQDADGIGAVQVAAVHLKPLPLARSSLASLDGAVGDVAVENDQENRARRGNFFRRAPTGAPSS